MPRKPKGDRPMTGAERAKAHRARKAKPSLGEQVLQAAHEGIAIARSPMDVLCAAWGAADKATRESFLASIDLSPKYAGAGSLIETPIVVRSKRYTAPPGSLLKK